MRTQQTDETPPRFDAARAILRDAVTAGACPAAVIEVGRSRGPLWQEAFGRLTYEAGAPRTGLDTIFDLASLTKVICTTTQTMRAVDAGHLRLEDRVAHWLPDWRGVDREAVTIRDLLAHASGLTGYLAFFRDPERRGRLEYQRAICGLPLEYRPRSRSVYSDLGFILLAFILEDAIGEPLARQFAAMAALVAPEPLVFLPPAAWRSRIAPTEIDPWRGRLLVGEVHDENCAALGGAAGHAGLFGTASAVGGFARLLLGTIAADSTLARRATVASFLEVAGIPGSSRALGWDTMVPTASCGRLMPADAVGHTGFTGTSLWIAPSADLYVVLLTNRIHPTRDNDALRSIRPRVHDAVMQEIGVGPDSPPGRL